MAIGFNEPSLEKRLERHAKKRAVRTTKKGLAIAILERAAAMTPESLDAWLRGEAAVAGVTAGVGDAEERTQ